MDDSHGWVTVQSSFKAPLSCLWEREETHSPSFTHTHAYPLTRTTFCFSFPVFNSPILSPFSSPSVSRILVDSHSSCFCFLSHTHTHTCAHSHTGIWGIYRGVVELVMGLCFDAQWEITGPRSRDKSTIETQVSGLAYALQTHSHIHLHTSITRVPE